MCNFLQQQSKKKKREMNILLRWYIRVTSRGKLGSSSDSDTFARWQDI